MRFEKLLIFDDAGCVAVDRCVFVCADIPYSRGSPIRCCGGGEWSGLEADGNIAVELGHGTLEAIDHLVDARCKVRHS